MASFENESHSRHVRKQLENIAKTIDRMEEDNKVYYKKFMTKLMLHNIRDAELNKVSEMLKEVDFAAADTVDKVY